MVEHGATIMVHVRRGSRELEAQTAIKRGYLNLLHAREAIARQVATRGGSGRRRRMTRQDLLQAQRADRAPDHTM